MKASSSRSDLQRRPFLSGLRAAAACGEPGGPCAGVGLHSRAPGRSAVSSDAPRRARMPTAREEIRGTAVGTAGPDQAPPEERV